MRWNNLPVGLSRVLSSTEKPFSWWFEGTTNCSGKVQLKMCWSQLSARLNLPKWTARLFWFRICKMSPIAFCVVLICKTSFKSKFISSYSQWKRLFNNCLFENWVTGERRLPEISHLPWTVIHFEKKTYYTHALYIKSFFKSGISFSFYSIGRLLVYIFVNKNIIRQFPDEAGKLKIIVTRIDGENISTTEKRQIFRIKSV